MMQLNTNKKFRLDPDNSVSGEDCPNILIKGDSNSILPELASIMSEKIKCVYLDPPYNNGDTYYYYDDSMGESWVETIEPVLKSLRNLLTSDGSIWISIDDREMAYLKVAADEIFGRENFVATIVWQHRKTRENRAVFSCNHEYILVYAKDIKSFKKSRNLLPVGNDFISKKYKNPDNDPRGPWQSVSASVQDGHAVPSQFYTIVSPAGIAFDPPKGRCWAYNQKRMQEEIDGKNIWFGPDGKNVPRIKKFLCDAKLGLTPQTLWTGDEVGTTDSAKKHLLSLFSDDEKIFETPKPEALLKRIIEVASNQNDYVLDCFCGSGTTMAVAQKLGRHYIGIEIGQQIIDLIVPRLKKVINGEQGGISSEVEWKGGGEFVLYNYIPSK